MTFTGPVSKQKGPKRAPGARHARGSARSKSPGGPLLGKLDSRPTSLGQSLWPRACSRCAPIRATDVVASRHRIGGLDASAGDSRRAPSFTSARDSIALNCRARAKSPSFPAQARVVYHFSVPLLSALPTEASVEQGPAEGLERRLKPSSITEDAAGGSAASQKDHMAHKSRYRDGVLRAAARVKRHLDIAINKGRSHSLLLAARA